MKYGHGVKARGLSGRSPHGERGLKSWRAVAVGRLCACRSPHGERGLKFALNIALAEAVAGRSPHGERGLKFYNLHTMTT